MIVSPCVLYITIACLITVLVTIFIKNNELTQLRYDMQISLSEEQRIGEVNRQKILADYQQLKFEYEVQASKLVEYEKLLNNTDLFMEQFTHISHKTLNEQSEGFFKKIDFFLHQINNKQQDNTKDFNKLLEPLVNSIQEFHNRSLTMEKDRITSNESIRESLKSLTHAYMDLREATMLLTSSHRTAGQWGEIQLIRLLEYTGLLKYCEFREQVHMETEEGILRPDVVVTLPNNISIAIDAKSSVVSYAKYQNSSNEDNKRKYKKEFYRMIKTHITTLGSKKYWSQFKTSPEMVIMFLPGEGFWQTALEEDEHIMEYAYNLNVVVTTPLTLIPLLRIIASIWGKFQISQEAEELRKKSLFMYETLIKITNLVYDFGKTLENNSRTYNKILSLERDAKQTLEEFREIYFPLLPSMKIFHGDS